MRGNVPEIWKAVFIAGHAIAIVPKYQEMLAVLTATGNRNVPGMGVDAVLDQLRNGLQRIALRKCDDADRIPVVADPQLTMLSILGIDGSYTGHR